MIEQSLQNALLDEDIHRDVVSLITQVLVRADDPAITRPTKFIGEPYPRARAEELSRKYGWHIAEQSEGSWRRVVGSPTPLRINNGVSIKRMVEGGTIVIAAGGGGIPTYVDQRGRYEGVDAVIDKDLAAAVLGTTIEAAELYIITDVPAVYLDFGTRRQRALKRLHVDEADRHLKAGQFPPGNMGPKISAAIQFIQQGGKQVLLTDIASIEQALADAAGTTIYN
jgi:carbamate kinase